MRIVIWADSSFAVEWLSGTDRAKRIDLPKGTLSILPMQYCEIFSFFLKKSLDPVTVANELEALDLQPADKIHLQQASMMYVVARRNPKCKASLADAILAATAKERREKIVAFDDDFADLGLKEKSGIWEP